MRQETLAHPRRVLVIRLGQLGDLLLCLPALSEARRRAPDLQLTVLTRRTWAGVLERSSIVQQIGCIEDLASPVQLWQWVRNLRLDEVWELQGTLRSCFLGRLVAHLSGARLRIPPRQRLERQALLKHSWPGQVARLLLSLSERLHRADRRSVSDRSCVADLGRQRSTLLRQWERPLELVCQALPPVEGEARGTRRLGARPLEAHAWRPECCPGLARAGTALLPGARHAPKRWPLRHWQRLAQDLDALGEPLVLLGGPEDDALLDALQQVVPGAARVQGDWHALLRCLSGCRLAIGHDSGLTHLAESVGTPVLMLMGPTVPELGFAPSLPQSRVLERSLPCRPCSLHGERACPLGHRACLERLEPAQVLRAWLAQGRSSTSHSGS